MLAQGVDAHLEPAGGFVRLVGFDVVALVADRGLHAHGYSRREGRELRQDGGQLGCGYRIYFVNGGEMAHTWKPARLGSFRGVAAP